MIRDEINLIKPVLGKLAKNFQQGKTMSMSFRKEQLQSMMKGLEALESEFEVALKEDLGYSKYASWVFSHAISTYSIEAVIKNFEKYSKPRSVDIPMLVGPGKSYLKPEPLGVALVIGAWNYPLFTSLPQVAEAISAGNVVILKPSELSPNTSNVMKKLFDNYLNPECYTVIEGTGETAQALLKEKFDLIIFTGSPQKGKLVAKAAAENLTPCILELGGKSPTIIDSDADIANAAQRILVAPDYIFVHSSISMKVIEEFKKTLIKFYGDHPENSDDLPRIVNEFHTKRLIGLIKENDANIIFGGKAILEEKFVDPTLILNPSLDSSVMTEEIFGPILPIIEFQNINEEVIDFINGREKPLALYYFGSKNKDLVLSGTSSGVFMQNDCVLHTIHQDLPFGGVGNSGLGAVHGQFGFDRCSHLKPVIEKGTMNSYPISSRFYNL